MTRAEGHGLAAQRMLRLGIIGMSEGNGHPFSWSAIINGYDSDAMESCPFPAIPDYLSQRTYPEDFIQGAVVTHVWTQDPLLSRLVATACRISNIADSPEDMIGEVDAILLARDDARNHYEFAKPFLAAGLPVYIDKPIALDGAGAHRLLALTNSDRQLFSCSALRYAKELQLTQADEERIGEVRFIDAWVPKYWDTYAIHVIEPIVAHFSGVDDVLEHRILKFDEITQLIIGWKSGLVTRFTSTGNIVSPIGYRVCGSQGHIEVNFSDSFSAFKSALAHFLDVMDGRAPNIPRDETLKIIDILELGRRKAVEL